MTTQLVCTFTVGELLFGVAVKHVQEVLRYQEMTPIPLAATTVRGLINLRGQIVTAIDMRARLGLPPRTNSLKDDAELPMNVVVQAHDGIVSLLVDAIGDVAPLDDDAYEGSPETLSPAFRHLVPGVYKLDGALLLLLDPERVAALGTDATAAPERAA